MSNITLLIIIISFSALYLYLIKLLKNDKFSKDLLFFLLIGIILIFTLTIFYCYFQELNLSIIISGLLVINNFLLIRELKLISNKSLVFSLPYFIIFLTIFLYLLIKLF